MRRRSLLLKTGGFVAAGAAIFGSGAFTRSEAERDVTIQVVGDGSANLRLYSGPGDHGNVVTQGSDGLVSIDVATVDNGAATPGEGVNEGTVTALDDVLGIENQGPDPVAVSAQFPPAGGIALFDTYTGPGNVATLDDPANEISLGSGASTAVGLAVDAGYGTGEIPGTFADGDAVSITIVADAT
ncbi:MAG: hypothetical protein V5A23_05970 [Halobacteriales archaeon]